MDIHLCISFDYYCLLIQDCFHLSKVIFNHFQHTPLSNYALSEAMIKLQKITNILQFEGVEDAVECFVSRIIITAMIEL